MTKNEFQDILRTSLEGEIPSSEVENNIKYYEEYINSKINDKSYDDIFAELGSPRLIAKTIIETYKISRGPLHDYNQHRSIYSSEFEEYTNDNQQINKASNSNTQRSYETYNHAYQGSNKQSKLKINNWYNKIIAYIIVILIIILVIFLGSIALRLFFTIGIPILFILFIYKLITRR